MVHAWYHVPHQALASLAGEKTPSSLLQDESASVDPRTSAGMAPTIEAPPQRAVTRPAAYSIEEQEGPMAKLPLP